MGINNTRGVEGYEGDSVNAERVRVRHVYKQQWQVGVYSVCWAGVRRPVVGHKRVRYVKKRQGKMVCIEEMEAVVESTEREPG